jgi:predicted nucleic acid-binding protein
LDTSVFSAEEQDRPLHRELLPDEVAISVVTLAELELGVHTAGTEVERAARLKTLGAVRAIYEPLPVDQQVASAFAELVASARRAGYSPKLQDTWIAATALANGIAIYTQDGDFDRLPGVDVVRV